MMEMLYCLIKFCCVLSKSMTIAKFANVFLANISRYMVLEKYCIVRMVSHIYMPKNITYYAISYLYFLNNMHHHFFLDIN